ncbi:MAG: glycosyltransferase family 1 protein [Patescibacteria group bacterium]|nr:glycosyltransferase family 1 protein [Patescibacteria group bacterium]
MRIGIDIRSLAEPKPGGVTRYAEQLLRRLFELDKKNEYTLFLNAWAQTERVDFDYPNVNYKTTRWPNKLFNSSLVFLKRPALDSLIGRCDVFFAPNLNFLSLSPDCPLVLTIHDLSFELYPKFLSWKRRLWHRFISPRRLVERADGIIAVSESTKRDLVELYRVSADKIKVIYPGVDARKFNSVTGRDLASVREKYRLNQSFIFSLSFLEPRKNLMATLQAFDLFKEKYPRPLQLILAGQSSWQHSQLERLRLSLKNREDVRFIGYVSESEKVCLMKLAQVFVYPSVYEGFGFPPLESLMAGTPVIISASASLPEVVGEAGIMIQPYNVAELTEAMRQVLNSPGLKQRLMNHRQELAEKYSWAKTAERTLNLLETTANIYAHRN